MEETGLMETALYYYRARHYDPKVGRFLQTDPIEPRPEEMNQYVYVANNPVNAIDPDGQFALALPLLFPVLEGLAGAIIGFGAGICIGEGLKNWEKERKRAICEKAYADCVHNCVVTQRGDVMGCINRICRPALNSCLGGI